MKITLDRATFTAALDRVGKVIEKRNTVPILSHMLVRTGDRTAVLAGTDLDMEARTTIEAEVEAEGAATFPVDLVAGFARKLPAGKVTLELKGGSLTVRSGRSRITVPSLDAGDFPELPPDPAAASFELEAGQLLALIERTAFAISTEGTRYYLNGIYLHAPVDGEVVLRAVATDGHRLARHQIACPKGAEGLPGIITPRKAVAEIARLAKPLGAEKVIVALSPTRLRLELGMTTLTTKLIDGTFPDYLRVIPASTDKVATLDAEALAAAVARVGTVSSERGRAVRFTFAAGAPLRLQVKAPDAGEATDEVDVEWSAREGLEIGFNGVYVADILAAAAAPKARLALSDAGSPCLITAEAAPGSLFVLMPMRV